MIRTQIQLTEDQMKALKRIATAHGVSVAELVRRAVDRTIASSPITTDKDRRAGALAIVGQFRSGQQDVSKRHDEYLAASFKDSLENPERGSASPKNSKAS